MSTLCIFTDYSQLSHVLCGDGLREEYKNFRITILRNADWASWHHKLVRAAPYTCGWSVRKDKLVNLKNALVEYGIPFVEKATFTPTVSATTPGEGKPRDQHTCKDMIYDAIKAQEPNYKGMSRYWIKKHIKVYYPRTPLLKVFNNTLRTMVEKGELVKTGDKFKLGTPAKKGSRLRVSKPDAPLPDIVEKLTPYTDLWDQWEVSAPSRSVVGEYVEEELVVTITIFNCGNEEKFAVLCFEGKYEEEYEKVAKIAWESSKLKDC